MGLTLNEYRDLINLDETYHPKESDANMAEFLSMLMNEKDDQTKAGFINELKKGRSRRDLVKALLTVRSSGDVTDQLIAMNDSMLQKELNDKVITEGEEIPRVESSYPFSDLISIWNGDISTLKVDAIVNAANHQMEGCFIPFHNCIDNVIHNASGIMLREDCAKIMERQGEIEKTADAKITRAYNLPSKYVIHTVGPIVNGFLMDSDKEALKMTYRACLDLAKESGLVKSIAFCSISTGVYGFPFEPAARIALETVAEWMSEHPGSIEQVVFNTFGDSATETYKRLIQEWSEM